ncbi:VTT domain-containing protein [uncultured Methanofollis sp.]|uniref:VTT domain-containing protein n=1 Tax=uncultured Methanofollis sp. TaxID=262500 RepID=UPI002618C85A|nr:VTT domain-containing protein [uncultured Methanofollis sp.]
MDRTRTVLPVWLVMVAGCLALYSLHPEYFSLAGLKSIAADHHHLALLAYFLLLSVRGLTLIPSTPLLISGALVFDPIEVFVANMAGILTSSTLVYRYARFLGIDTALEKRYPEQTRTVRQHLEDRELPVIAGWSVCPFVQTDLIVYIASTLRTPLWKCLVGVGAGQAAIVSFYIITVKAFVPV